MSMKSYAQKTTSVYGGAGGYGTRISSKANSFSDPVGYILTDEMDLHVGWNEKATMQNLNDRLASYLEKVHRLEKENERLEKQIREWYKNKTVVCSDHSSYYATIESLTEKIRIATMTNAKMMLNIDNARLATEDFKAKFETEVAMKMSVEADIAGLRKLLDSMNLTRMDLESQYESLKSELIVLKKNHEEDLSLLKNQCGQVNVEVDASPSIDLTEAMEEIRKHYESLIAKNNKELELWYKSKMTAVQQDVITHTECLVTSHNEIKDLKSTLQKLEIELQSSMTMKASLEVTLTEIQARFAAQLRSHQETIIILEGHLSQLHSDITSNKQEYDILLDLKTRLELEIAEYRRLLDGEDESTKQVITKVITVVETVVDGKVVQSSKTVDVDVDEVED